MSMRATGLLDAPPEERFDRLAARAAESLGAGSALITHSFCQGIGSA